MKMLNEKTGKVMEATPLMLKLMAIKGWVELPEDEPATVNNEEIEISPEIFEPLPPVSDEERESEPKADPVKVKAKNKNKKSK